MLFILKFHASDSQNNGTFVLRLLRRCLYLYVHFILLINKSFTVILSVIFVLIFCFPALISIEFLEDFYCERRANANYSCPKLLNVVKMTKQVTGKRSSTPREHIETRQKTSRPTFVENKPVIYILYVHSAMYSAIYSR